jgi:hypothetical protein
MINRLMITAAAAALIAGTGLANAQGTGMGRDAPSAGSTVQQGAPPSEKGAPSATPMNHDNASDSKGLDKGTKSTQSDQKALPNAANNTSAQGDIKAGPKGEKSAQDNNQKGERSKGMSSETNGPAGNDMKAEGRNGNKAETKGTAADSKATTTTGQAGAGAKLSTEQRTRITTVIRDQHVAPVANVNFAISVGTRIPRDITFHPLPTEIVTIYPEWRGYEFILVRDQIVVVDPRTFEIVAVLEA